MCLDFQQMVLDIHMLKEKKKRKLDIDLSFFTKINSKWTIDLNVKHKTMKLLKDNIQEYLNDFGFGGDFLDKAI